MGLFGGNSKKKLRQKNDKTVSYDDALRAGSSIGKLITNIWNSQKNPGKAYLLNRRVHHGEVGILLGLSNLIKKSRPATPRDGSWESTWLSLVLDFVLSLFDFVRCLSNPTPSESVPSHCGIL
jgi:hypothetical protein